MTVGELVNLLGELEPDVDVVYEDSEDPCLMVHTIDEVSVTFDSRGETTRVTLR